VAFAALVAHMQRVFSGPGSIGRWVSRGVGALFVALGVRLAFFDEHNS
jgi:threonine/homoserine/homoserine lactone efflux protein